MGEKIGIGAESGEGEMKAENDDGKEKTKGAARRFARALVPMFVGAVSALVVYYGIGEVFAYMNRIGATQAQSIIAVLFVANIVGISIFQAFQIALLRRRVSSSERDEMMTLALMAGLHALCGAVIKYLDEHTESPENENVNKGDAGNGRAEDAPNAEVALKAEDKEVPKAEGEDAPVKKSEPDETARTKHEKPLQAAPSKDDAKPASENVKKPEAKKEEKKDESEKFQGFM